MTEQQIGFRSLKPKACSWLTHIVIVLAMLLSFVSALEPSNPRLHARQQQHDPAGASSGAAASSGGNGGSSGSPLSSQQVTPTQTSATTPTSSPDTSSSNQPSSGNIGSSGGAVIGSGGVSNSTLPPLGSSGGTVIGGSMIGPNAVIDPRRPVSRISMLQPKQNTANPPLFSVGSNIAFEWVFDNKTLVFVPANLTIEVSLTANPKMVWPVANVSGTTTSAVWNTATVINPGLFMGFYTLSIYDTKLGKQGVATSGHLMPYSDLQFGLYIPEPYVPRAGAFCQTCSSGGSRSMTGATTTGWMAIAMASVASVAAATWCLG